MLGKVVFDSNILNYDISKYKFDSSTVAILSKFDLNTKLYIFQNSININVLHYF